MLVVCDIGMGCTVIVDTERMEENKRVVDATRFEYISVNSRTKGGGM